MCLYYLSVCNAIIKIFKIHIEKKKTIVMTRDAKDFIEINS